MKVAIIGSKTFGNYKRLKSVLDRMSISEIISGGAKGAYELAEKYASEKRIPTRIIRSNYAEFGYNAPVIKNQEIINSSEMVIAFWDSNTEMTKKAIDYASLIGKPLIVEYFKS